MNEPKDLPVAPLRRLARGLLFDDARAEDVVQDAWLAALRRRSAPANLVGWLASVVRSRALDVRRDEARRGAREERAARPEAQPSSAELSAQLELLRRLLDAVDRLDEPYRAAIGLRFFDDLPPRAIAKRLGLPVNTVRTHVRRGLEKLRKELDPGDERGRDTLLAALAPFAGARPWSLSLGAPRLAGATLAAGGIALLAVWFAARETEGSRSDAVAAQEDARTRQPTPAPLERASAARAQLPAPGRAPMSAAWVVRGHVASGTATPTVVPLHGRLRGGYERDAPVLVEEDFASDASGDFAWALEPPSASVLLEIEPRLPDHLAESAFERVARDDPAPEHVLVLARPLDAELAGTVRDAAGALVPGAWLAVGEQQTTTSDERGRYRLRVSSMQDTLQLSGGLPGRGAKRVDLGPFRPGEERDLDLVLAPELVLRGSVRDADGAPVEGAEVESVWPQMFAAPGGEDRTDASGGFELHLDRRSDGSAWIWLVARKPGLASAKLEDGLRRDGENSFGPPGLDPERLELVLGAVTRVAGRVRAADGRALEGVMVWCSLDPQAPEIAATDSDGRFTLTLVPRAKVELRAQRRGFVTLRRELDLSAGALDDLQLVLEDGRTLSGVVLDAQDHPVPWARLTSSSWTTGSDVDGRFELAGVSPSAKTITATAHGYAKLETRLGPEANELVLRLQPSARLRGQVLDAATGSAIRAFTLKLSPPEGSGQLDSFPSDWTDGIALSDANGAWDLQAEFPAGLPVALTVSADGYSPARAPALRTALDPAPEDCVVRLQRKTFVFGRVLDAESGAPIEHVRVTPTHSSTGSYESEDFSSGVRTDADGRFEIADLPSGTTWLAVEWLVYATRIDGPFEVGGSPVERRIELGHGASVAGRLLDEQGNGLAGETVSVRGRDALGRSFCWGVTTGADGSFEKRNLAGGSFTLEWTLRHGEFDPRTGPPPEASDLVEPFELEPDGRREIVLRPLGQTKLQGTLAFSGALPEIVPVSLTLLDEAGRPTRRGRGALAEGGLFVVPYLEQGRYAVAADFRLADFTRVTGQTSVDVPANGQVEVQLEVGVAPR